MSSSLHDHLVCQKIDIASTIDFFGLRPYLFTTMHNLSGGWCQRVSATHPDIRKSQNDRVNDSLYERSRTKNINVLRSMLHC